MSEKVPFDCPHCNTKGLFLTSDSCCPNCTNKMENSKASINDSIVSANKYCDEIKDKHEMSPVKRKWGTRIAYGYIGMVNIAIVFGIIGGVIINRGGSANFMAVLSFIILIPAYIIIDGIFNTSFIWCPLRAVSLPVIESVAGLQHSLFGDLYVMAIIYFYLSIVVITFCNYGWTCEEEDLPCSQSVLSNQNMKIYNNRKKQRHWLLTSYLVVIIVASVSVLIYLIYPKGNNVYFKNAWVLPVLILLSLFNVICSIALFKWKKWGFWGICVISVIMSFVVGRPPLGVLLLWVALNIGKENKGWPQLE